jgi:hypothetical protein
VILSIGWEVQPFRANMKLIVVLSFLFVTAAAQVNYRSSTVSLMYFCAINFIFLKSINGQVDNDVDKVAQSWREALLDNLALIAILSTRVMRPATTTFLASQNMTFKANVKRRIRPLLPSDEAFEDVYATMNLEVDCSDPDYPPIILNELRDDFTLADSAVDWFKAECKRRTEVKESYRAIDAFYILDAQDVTNFCDAAEGAADFVESRLNDLVEAIKTTDDLVTEMFEDLSRRPSRVRKPSPMTYATMLTSTRDTLGQEFLSRIKAKTLIKPCPKRDVSKQLDIVIDQRPTRPILATTSTTKRPTTTTGATTTAGSRVNPFLLNVFGRRNGK